MIITISLLVQVPKCIINASTKHVVSEQENKLQDSLELIVARDKEIVALDK